MAKHLLIASWTGLVLYLGLIFTSELHSIDLLHILIAPLHAFGLFDRVVSGPHYIMLIFAEGLILWGFVLPIVFVAALHRLSPNHRLQQLTSN